MKKARIILRRFANKVAGDTIAGSVMNSAGTTVAVGLLSTAKSGQKLFYRKSLVNI